MIVLGLLKKLSALEKTIWSSGMVGISEMFQQVKN
jgi:hypothetical protein